MTITMLLVNTWKPPSALPVNSGPQAVPALNLRATADLPA
jgi:hypothetical protein